MSLSKDKTQISVVLPREIVELLDIDAKVELRTRSQQAAKLIIKHYQNPEIVNQLKKEH